MNTFSIAALLLPVLSATLTAQDLKLEVNAQSGFEARVGNASEGSLVILVLGMQPGAVRLPGGQVLGVQPDMLAGTAIASRGGEATLSVPMGRDVRPFACFVQAAALHPRLPIDVQGGITLSQVEKVQVGAR